LFSILQNMLWKLQKLMCQFSCTEDKKWNNQLIWNSKKLSHFIWIHSIFHIVLYCLEMMSKSQHSSFLESFVHTCSVLYMIMLVWTYSIWSLYRRKIKFHNWSIVYCSFSFQQYGLENFDVIDRREYFNTQNHFLN
jgi:hypothetical protein